jgi:hypothetical protein
MPEAVRIEVLFATQPLVPQRAWLEALAIAVPGSTATRWLLLADVACLVGIALASRRPWLAVPITLVLGFTALNTLGLLLTDFYLGLAAFHVVVGITTMVMLRRARWLGGATLALSMGLGVLT